MHHVYLNGYTYGRLVDPTLELDDSLHPYWTISLMQPSRGYTGDTFKQVLLVDAHTGTIKAYNPQDVPSWVDRVMPAETVTQYLSWWGLYHSAPWFNPSGLGQQTPASTPELLYNNADQPVWLIPMTSASANDSSSTGLYCLIRIKTRLPSIRKRQALVSGDNVTSTFQSTRANIRAYSVASVGYQIYNTPTWVAIYAQNTSSGDIFQAVGLVDAREPNGNNVQFDPDLASGLQDYQQWLTTQQSSGNSGGTNSSQPQTVTGKVLRISSVIQGTSTIYYLQIAGQPYIFTANLSLSPKLPLVQTGDTVTMTYSGNTGNVVNLQTFDDTSIQIGSSSTSPGELHLLPRATPTAVVKPKK